LPPDLGPRNPRSKPFDIGYIEGVSYTYGAGEMARTAGIEQVFDLYDYEYAIFAYKGKGIYFNVGAGVSGYIGAVIGWNSERFPHSGVQNYSGPFISGSVSIPVAEALGAGLQGFLSPTNPEMAGVAVSANIGMDLIPADYTPSGMAPDYELLAKISFHAPGKRPTKKDALDFARFIQLKGIHTTGTALAMSIVLLNADLWAWHQEDIPYREFYA